MRRWRRSGDLYTLNPGDPTGLRFPRWQFTSPGSVVPGFRHILPAFPRDTHPLVIGKFMTQAHEDLDGMSPIGWLTADGPIDPVVALVQDLGYV